MGGEDERREERWGRKREGRRGEERRKGEGGRKGKKGVGEGCDEEGKALCWVLIAVLRPAMGHVCLSQLLQLDRAGTEQG